MTRIVGAMVAAAVLAAPMAADAALCRNKRSGAVAVKPVCAKKFVPAIAADLGVTDPDGGLAVGNAGIGIADGGVTSDRLAPGAVTTDKLAVVPAARVAGSIPIDIPGNAAFTALTFNVERFDTADVHAPADPTRLTAPVAGIYLVSANVSWETNASGAREVNLRKNGSTLVLRDVVQPVGGGNTTEQAVSTIVALAAGDFVEVVLRQNSGSTLAINAFEEFSPEFSMAWIGALP